MKKPAAILKVPTCSFVFFSYFFLALPADAAALDVSQKPLVLVDSVAPNLIVTLDDSGSMLRAAVPDDLTGRHDRRTKSSSYNPLYYNPQVSYLIPRGLDSSGEAIIYDTSFNKAWHNGFDTSDGYIDLKDEYKVNWYCDHANVGNCTYSSGSIGKQLGENPEADFVTGSGKKKVDRTQSSVPAYYYVLNSTCLIGSSQENCYRKVDVTATSGPDGVDERRNFAIWYSFYRDRGLATKTAAHLAFYTLPSDMRLTWQALNRCTKFNSTSNECVDNHFRKLSAAHKANFYSWLRNISFGDGTPLRAAMGKAGEFLTTSSAWAANPNPIGGTTIKNPEFSCRASYHIMMTDGIWNGADGKSNRSDDSKFTLSANGRDYVYDGKRAPFADSTSNTLADVAMNYWATDLYSALDNEVKPYLPYRGGSDSDNFWDPRNNPATWQSMSNFMVALGLSNSMDKSSLPWAGAAFEGVGYSNLKSGTSWPKASSDDNNNVYDLWHAAINSRGDFFSAESPEDLTAAFKDILNRIAERQSTAAAAGSSTSVSADDPSDPYGQVILNRAFFPEFDSADWSGDVKRKDIQRVLGSGLYQRTQEWSAREKLNGVTPSQRNIYMAGGSQASGLRGFLFNNLNTEQQTLFNKNPDSFSGAKDGLGTARVDYLRGERSREGYGDNDFRARSSLLGDIINSTPVVVGSPAYVPYLADKIDGKSGDYLAFRNKYADRPEMVYVGANDGMLHAFLAGKVTENQAGQQTVVYEGGKEAFSYVPSAVINNLPKLAAQSYKSGAHQFFVDGSPTVRDVYMGGEWRTVLIGTLRAGGKSVFALDITDPKADGSGVKLLWEISNETTGYSNLGYTFPEPEVVRLHGGQWALLLGNGYDSSKDAASLFVIGVEGGTLIKEIVVDKGDGAANGLSTVRGADNNGDGVVDYAYAGDLQGKLWRFDLVKSVSIADVPDPFSRNVQLSVTAADYKVSYGGTPLYTARSSNNRAQPITAVPSLVRHPTRRGYLVIFGTGKFFETDDASGDTEKANSVYAIWDRLTRAESTSAGSLKTLSRSDLKEQSINSEQVSTFSSGGASQTWETRTLSSNNIEWYLPSTDSNEEVDRSKVRTWGWVLDLSVKGKGLKGELVKDRMLARGDSLIFGTLTPNEDPCADGATYWAYGINSATGGRLDRPALDFNRDGRFDDGDTIQTIAPSGYSTDSPIALGKDGTIISLGDQAQFEPSPELQGRQSWQRIPLD